MFNKRRQSKDRVVVEKVKEIIGGDALYVSEYSSNLFENATICETLTNIDGFAFIENPMDLNEEKIEKLYIFKWNRHYPSDKKFNLDLTKFELVSTEDFAGYSHENITLETYIRKDA